MFRARLPSNFNTHRTKCHACHEICTLSPLDAALPMRFTKNTQHDTSKVLRLPRKMTMDTSKVLRLPRKLQHIFCKRCKSIAPATQNDFRHLRTWKFATLQNRCFVRGFRQFSTYRTKCHARHEIYTLSPLDAALPMRFTKNTQHDTSKVLRLPRKMTMDISKVLRLPRKLQHIFCKRCKSIAPATQNDFRHVTEHVWMSRSATPATRNEATRRLKLPKRTTSAKLTIGTAI